MHKFIYPAKDTYINNSSTFEDKNFGIDEILEVYASNKGSETIFTTPNWHAGSAALLNNAEMQHRDFLA